MNSVRYVFKDHLITITALFFMLGIAGTRPLIPLLSNELNASPFEIGIIISLFPLLPFFLAIKLGQFIDRVGYKKPIIIGSLLGSLALIIPMVVVNLPGIYASQIIAGITQTMFAVAIQTYVGNSSEKSKREQNIMKFSIGVAIGAFLGPLFGGILADRWGYPLAFGLLGSVGFLSSFLALFLNEGTRGSVQIEVEKNKRFHSLSLLKIPNLKIAIFISILVLLGKDIYVAFFPLFAIEKGLSSTMIGFIISINAVAGILIRWLMPYLLDKYSRDRVIIGSIVSAGMLLFSIPFFESWIMLAVISFVLGMGLGLGQPLSISTTMYSLPKERVGEGMGLRLTANRFTQMSAPVIFGAYAELASMSGIFWIVGFLIILGGTRSKIKEEIT